MILSLRHYFFHAELALGQHRQVELQFQVGCAGAALHVEHLEVMSSKILKCVAAEELRNSRIIFIGPVGAIRELMCFPELIFYCRVGVDCLVVFITMVFCCIQHNITVDIDVTGVKVNFAAEGVVYATHIQQQHVVHVDPHVVVAIELEHHGVAMVREAAGVLHKFRRHDHAEVVVAAAVDDIQVFVPSGIV